MQCLRTNVDLCSGLGAQPLGTTPMEITIKTIPLVEDLTSTTLPA